MKVIEIDGFSLTCAQLKGLATIPALITLAPSGRIRAAASRDFADLVAGTRPLYGRSTGVGANRSVSAGADPRAHVLMLLRSHATSAGSARSNLRVRAMLLVRLNQLARGGSGVAPAILDALTRMISADALPVIAERGSVGTADLSALATAALALMGEGPTIRPMPGSVEFGRSDGLAFISSNAAAIGDSALAVADLEELLRAAPVVAALTMVATRGNAEAFSEPVELVTPFSGARVICGALRRLVDGGGPPARIQDPFALRTLPQVLGPAVDALMNARHVVESLMNAPTENPLVLPADSGRPAGSVAHHGAFHHAYLQLAMDTLALAIAQSGQSVLARLGMLTEPAYTGLTPFLSDGTAGASGVMICEYVAASALGAMRAVAQPAGLQTVTLSRGVEDDASFASLAATQAMTLGKEFRTLLATELVAALRAIRMGSPVVPFGLAPAVARCQELSPDVSDRDLTRDLGQAEALLSGLADIGPRF